LFSFALVSVARALSASIIIDSRIDAQRFFDVMKTFVQFPGITFERKSRAKRSMSSSSSHKNRVEGISGAIAGLLALLATYPLITLNTRQHVREKTKTKTKSTTGSTGKEEVDFEDDEDVEKKTERIKRGEKPRVRLVLPMVSSKTRDDANETGKVEEIIRGGETSLDWDGVFARRVLLLVFGIQRRIFTPETRTTFRTTSARGTERIFNTD
jgi:hypothetical protein